PRLTSLKEFAHKKGKKETDLGVQVEFLLSELNSSYSQSSKKILAMTDVHEACKEWVMKFEGLSQDSSQWYLDQRNSYADHWYATLGTSDPIAEGTISNGADSELNTLTCDLESDGGDIMGIAKS
ncbi:phage tail tip lysozyme, partial [Escherichia coli]|uniref:phage tail tip lysozyme n=1 Tax=Escherichia coli TaxID=562 RepID=UPI003CF3A4E1